MTLDPRIAAITDRIITRSRPTRARYLDRMARAAQNQPARKKLGCANLAHGFAACGPSDKADLRGGAAPNIGIVTAYNDMLSAHQPYERFPDIIKEAARAAGGTAQVAGGVPAMCDGVTQGEAGMELSLFSRDVIALATGVALSHQMFDAALYLGVCDKIVPGLVIGALAFGHLPALFVPAGPMTSGLSNDEKSRIRQLFAEGKVGRDALLEAEVAILPRAGHLHVLRHGEHEPDADGDHGAAHSRLLVRQPQHAPARRAHPRRDAPGAGDHRARQCLHAAGTGAGREGVRERHRRPQRNGRLHQPHDPSHRHGCGRGNRAHLGRFRRPLGGNAAADPRLSKRQGRREPFPCRGRDGLPHPRTRAGGPAAPGRHHRLGRRARRLHGASRASRPTARSTGPAARRPAATPPFCARLRKRSSHPAG